MQDEMNDPQYTTAEDPDIVKVVRCKDCCEYDEWLGEHICVRLGSYHGETKPDDYCSYGRRKE